jgi:hypothetical protein
MLYTPPGLINNQFSDEDGTLYYKTSAPVSTLTLSHRLRRSPEVKVFDVATELPILASVKTLSSSSILIETNDPYQLLIQLT